MLPTRAIEDCNYGVAVRDTELGNAGYQLEVHLSKAPFRPGPNLTLAQLTEADFPGYTPVLVNESNVDVTVEGDAFIFYNDAIFTRNAGGAAQVIYGYYVIAVHASGGPLMGGQMFDRPSAMLANMDFIRVFSPHLVYRLSLFASSIQSTH